LATGQSLNQAITPTYSHFRSTTRKAPPFSRPALERLVATELLPRRSSPQAPIAKTFVAVQAAVRDLFGRRGKLLLELTNLVVEAFDEDQKALLDLAVGDPMSAFRLGAPAVSGSPWRCLRSPSSLGGDEG
jgi:hypothetical protein